MPLGPRPVTRGAAEQRPRSLDSDRARWPWASPGRRVPDSAVVCGKAGLGQVHLDAGESRVKWPDSGRCWVFFFSPIFMKSVHFRNDAELRPRRALPEFVVPALHKGGPPGTGE